jgi:holin-like protein
MIIPRNYTFDDFNSFLSATCAHYTGASSHFKEFTMTVASVRVTPAVVQRLQVPVQVLLYAALFVFAEYLVDWLHLPLPANLVGMVLMFSLILCRIIPLRWVRAGSRWLLAEMLLFFVPAVVAVVNYAQLLLVDGWRIFAVIALSTLMVLGSTAWVVDKVYRFEIRRQKHDSFSD